MQKEGDTSGDEDTPRTLSDTIDAMMSIRENVMSKVASNIASAQSVQKAQYDKRRHATEYRIGDKVLMKNLFRDDRKGGRFTERRTGPYTVAEVCGKNTYRLTGENNNVLKRKVNSSNLVKYIDHETSSKPALDTAEPATNPAEPATNPAEPSVNPAEPAAKRVKLAQDDVVLEKSTTESKIFNVSPVCEAWQREKCKEFNLDLIRSNGIHHGPRSRTLRATQRLKTSRIKGDGNCLFRAFSSVISGTQDNHDILRTLTVSYMLENPQVFDSICDNVSQYIVESRMASLGVWGTEIEIFALATMLHSTVYVFSNCGMTTKWLPYRPLLECAKDSHTDDIFISNLSHHFEPAVL